MMDLGWAASAAPIALGVGIGLAGRQLIAANDRRRARAARVEQAPPTPPAGGPKAAKTLRYPVPAGQR